MLPSLCRIKFFNDRNKHLTCVFIGLPENSVDWYESYFEKDGKLNTEKRLNPVKTFNLLGAVTISVFTVMWALTNWLVDTDE